MVPEKERCQNLIFEVLVDLGFIKTLTGPGIQRLAMKIRPQDVEVRWVKLKGNAVFIVWKAGTAICVHRWHPVHATG